MDKMKQLLSFLRIIDENGILSITNIAVLVVLVKLCMAPAASLTEVGTLMVALANYSAKKLINANNQEPTTDPLAPQVADIQKQMEEVTSQVSAMSIQAGISRKN